MCGKTACTVRWEGRPGSQPAAPTPIWSVAQGVPLQTDHMGETLSARGTSPTGCIIDGPLAFDNANDGEAAAEKSIASDVAGDADILLAPEIESGNILAKQLALVSHADAAGIVMGARVPSS